MMMKTNNVVLRRNIVDHISYPKDKLIRIVLTKDKQVILDKNQSILGRGAYIYPSIESVTLAKNKRLLNKIFHLSIDENIYDEMINFIKESR